MKKRQKVFLVGAILWMALIFIMSSREAELSQRDSSLVGELVGRIFVPGFEQMEEPERLDFVMGIDHTVRKCAHASEYALLGILAFGTLFDRSIKRAAVCAWLWATLYAASDELHQLFVPGRSGQLSDVLLDSAGAIAGILIIILPLAFLRRRG